MWIYMDIINAGLWGGLTGLLARRKNRPPLTWGLFGAFVWLIAPVFLFLLPRICPNCGEWLCSRENGENICDCCRAAKLKEALNSGDAGAVRWRTAALTAETVKPISARP